MYEVKHKQKTYTIVMIKMNIVRRHDKETMVEFADILQILNNGASFCLHT